MNDLQGRTFQTGGAYTKKLVSSNFSAPNFIFQIQFSFSANPAPIFLQHSM